MYNPTPFKSVAAAAKAAGLARQNLHKMLNGKEKPGVVVLLRLSQAWEMSLPELVKIFYPEEYEQYKGHL